MVWFFIFIIMCSLCGGNHALESIELNVILKIYGTPSG